MYVLRDQDKRAGKVDWGSHLYTSTMLHVSFFLIMHRLVGQVIKASPPPPPTPKAEGPEFESPLRGDFFPGRVIPVT